MTSVGSGPLALVVVPQGRRPAALAAAVARAHPSWTVECVWAGDPLMRPVCEAPSRRWFDGARDGSPRHEFDLVTCSPEIASWLRALGAVRSGLELGHDAVVVLVAGSVAVLRSLDALVAPLSNNSGPVAPAMFVAKAIGPLHGEGVPLESDLVAHGSYSTSVAAFGAASHELIEWMERQLRAAPIEDGPGRVFERAAVAFGLTVCTDASIGAGPFRWGDGVPSLLDLPAFVPDEPWSLDPSRPTRARVDVAGDPVRRRTIEGAAEQFDGDRRTIRLPGGMVIDDVLRRLVREALADGVEVPAPFSDIARFRTWLSRRYWSALHASRRDLAAAFPDVLGADAGRFTTWGRRAFVDDTVSPVLDVPPHVDTRWEVADTLADGVDVVGYLTRESSLGDVARRLRSALETAGVPGGGLAYQRTASPETPDAVRPADVVAHRHTLAVVNADQFPALAMDHPELFSAGTHRIGYWFWELEHVPADMRRAASMVDEIWVGSQFVADAVRAAVRTPVRCVPVPVPEPVASGRGRASFPALSGVADRFLFAVVFDHFSVTERKNPVGVVQAFTRAFAPGEGPVLVVKSMNAARRWPQHQHVVHAAADRPDVILWDEHLSRADQMAFIREVDALVSLHRSEGLGLHLAEAMWLGTPVIATRYSGNLDFMDDESALLVDATMTPVVRGEGVYPACATWADPDLDQAAAAMRRLVDDRALSARLSANARRRMERQPSSADTGRTIASLLGVPLRSGTGVAS
jgi:glycosyltransferase involved in cell wall biosynthesis